MQECSVMTLALTECCPTAAAAACEQMKKELRAAYGIKIREESPLEEVER